MSKRVALRCPICQKISFHKLSLTILEERKNIDSGLVPVLIEHVVCEHIFIAYVDVHFQVRHYIPVKTEFDLPFTLRIAENANDLAVVITRMPKKTLVY